ncbi:hypothetical protein NQD34_007656 [Periophthalmus magnuspinnatus]|nr:hypothetical protein NQD34_007656 [Periophthalmus magnuspinnatus]
MKNAVVFCLFITFAAFQLSDSLECYSCPRGSTQPCEVKETCANGLNGCLKLKHAGSTYSSCVNYNHCDFDSLSLKYPQFPQFKFSCCQSNLCNGRSIAEKIKDFFS